MNTVAALNRELVGCRACPRLVQWREQVARERRAAFADQEYWGRPVPGFGDPDPRLLIVGLAPAAHGANRTGRMFTGDRSGDWLFAALHRAGLASQPASVAADDGLTLHGTYITAAVHCAPPANKPTTVERDTCRSWLLRELQIVWPGVRAVVVLGGFGWAALWPGLRAGGFAVPPRPPAFGHGVEVEVDGRTVLGCYHVSQQNTFTGRLTEPMLDAVFDRARAIVGPLGGHTCRMNPGLHVSIIVGDVLWDAEGGEWTTKHTRWATAKQASGFVGRDRVVGLLPGPGKPITWMSGDESQRWWLHAKRHFEVPGMVDAEPDADSRTWSAHIWQRGDERMLVFETNS